jgi:VWFA-related protein
MRRESLRQWVGLGVSVIACLASGAAPAASQQPPAFPAGVELVRIDVVVVDKDGKPVTGLKAADFEITEGGKPHEIASFEPVVVRPAAKEPGGSSTEPPRVSSSVTANPDENRYFLIFFDDVHLSALSAERVRAQLTPFLERETHDGDWLTIVAPLEGLRWTARTAYERQQLAAVVQSLKGQLVRSVTKGDPSDYEAMRIAEYGGGELAPVMPGRNA